MSASGAMAQKQVEYGSRERPQTWSWFRKVGFRFLFCYVLLFATQCINHCVVASTIFNFTHQFPMTPLDKSWGVVVSMVAKYIFRLGDFRFDQGSDTVSGYLRFAIYALISLLATLVWSFIDRKREDYSKLNHWLRLYSQFALSVTLIEYGFEKVIPTQFGDLTPSRLVGTVGDLTPFSMLWDFMASSKPYTIFSGILEVLAGILLITPRLRSLGALLAIGVMTNVFALNVCYDVSVKLFSLQLLLLAIYLASPEFPRLVNVLVLSREVQPRPEAPLVNSQSLAKWPPLIQGVLGGCFVVLSLTGNLHWSDVTKASYRDVPLSGIWEVDQFNKLGNSQLPLFTSKLADKYKLAPGHDGWTKIIIEEAGSAVLQLEDGTLESVNFVINKRHDSLDVSDSGDPKWKVHFAMQEGTNVLNLKGVINNLPVEIRLHATKKSFRLTSGEYHIVWFY